MLSGSARRNRAAGSCPSCWETRGQSRTRSGRRSFQAAGGHGAPPGSRQYGDLMPTRRSWPVLVVETTVLVRVSAERLTVTVGFVPKSRSSHLKAASSPCLMPVRRARVIKASSRVPVAARRSLEASSWDRDLMGAWISVRDGSGPFISGLLRRGSVETDTLASDRGVQGRTCLVPTAGFPPRFRAFPVSPLHAPQGNVGRGRAPGGSPGSSIGSSHRIFMRLY